MSQGSNKSFTCPHCHKRFLWSTQIADRKAQCSNCAKKIRIPTVPGRVAEAVDPLPKAPKAEPQLESNTYELDLTGIDESIVEAPPSAAQKAADQTGRCPACNQSIKPGAVICIKCGYNLKKGKRVQTNVLDGDSPDTPPNGSVKIPDSVMASIGTSPISRALEDHDDEASESRFIDLWLPLILIVLGLAGEIISQLFFYHDPPDSVVTVFITVGIELVIRIPLLLIAMVIAVKLLDVAFGPLGQALLKLCAVVLGPSAIVAGITLLFGGGLIGLLFGLILAVFFYWLLIHILFDLDGGETIMFIVIISVINRAAEFAILVILGLLIA